MARPKKPDDEKLVPVTVYIRPSRYDQYDREAKAADTDLSKLLRKKLDPPISLQENQKQI